MAPPASVNDPATAFCVQEFQALRPRRPDGEAEAMELLRRAAWQVQPIMKRRQWRIAVLRELDARGPFCSLVMSVTVVKDVLVLLLFSVNVELVQAVEGSDGVGFAALAARCIATPLLKLTVSAMLGTAGGLLLGALLVQPRVGDRGALPAAVLLLAAALFLGARALPAEPLLVCVAAGALAANRREERGERQRE
jgi:hypothetical protein